FNQGPAGCNPAIQQNAILRYASGSTLAHSFYGGLCRFHGLRFLSASSAQSAVNSPFWPPPLFAFPSSLRTPIMVHGPGANISGWLQFAAQLAGAGARQGAAFGRCPG